MVKEAEEKNPREEVSAFDSSRTIKSNICIQNIGTATRNH